MRGIRAIPKRVVRPIAVQAQVTARQRSRRMSLRGVAVVGGSAARVDEGEIGSINREVLMLGDSLLAWFREEGLGRRCFGCFGSSFSVANLSVSGSMVLEGDESIPSQYVGGDWGWVVFDGGGNDANDLCECGACDEILDEIIGEATNEGVVPDFARAMRNAGHRVLVLGYYGCRRAHGTWLSSPQR